MRFYNLTEFETQPLRMVIQACLATKRATPYVNEVRVVRGSTRSRAAKTDEVDGAAYFETREIVLTIPPAWKVLGKNRLIEFCQVCLHEIQHLLYWDMPHHHMVPFWADVPPILPVVRVQQTTAVKHKPRGRKGR